MEQQLVVFGFHLDVDFPVVALADAHVAVEGFFLQVESCAAFEFDFDVLELGLLAAHERCSRHDLSAEFVDGLGVLDKSFLRQFHFLYPAELERVGVHGRL